MMDVYDICDELVKKLEDWKLIAAVSSNINRLKNNYEKVNFVEQALIEFKFMDGISSRVPLRKSKCNKRSTEFRMLGNKQFSLKNQKYFQVENIKKKHFSLTAPTPKTLLIRCLLIFWWFRHWNCTIKVFVSRKLTLRIYPLDMRIDRLSSSNGNDIKSVWRISNWLVKPITRNV